MKLQEKRLNNKKRYVLIYRMGDRIATEQATADEVRKTVARWQLAQHEYAVIDGKVMKSFVSPFNLINLPA